MENPVKYSGGLLHQSSSFPGQRRTGYEPSGTETKWIGHPIHNRCRNVADLGFEGLNIKDKNPTPPKLNQKHSTKFEVEGTSLITSPNKPQGFEVNALSPICDSTQSRTSVNPQGPGHESRKSVSTLSRRRSVSPFQPISEDFELKNDEFGSSYKEKHEGGLYREIEAACEKRNYGHRSLPARRVRFKENELQTESSRSPSLLLRNITPLKLGGALDEDTLSVGAINELVANTKTSSSLVVHASNWESIDSIPTGDIFFSRDCAAEITQRDIFLKNSNSELTLNQSMQIVPVKMTTADVSGARDQPNGKILSSHDNAGRSSSSTALTRATVNSRSAISRQSSNLSNASGSSTRSFRKFTVIRLKSQTEAWFSCIKKGSCRTSNKSPEKCIAFDEASFIAKAFVVESIRQFWADEHQPMSLNELTCHKQEALQLKKLVTHEILPHILFKGPPGSGKKTLTKALLCEIYGDAARKVSRDLRSFRIRDRRTEQVVIPLASSPHHVELTALLEPNARYALMELVKRMSSNHAAAPEISSADVKADYTVIVLHDVEKADQGIQHLIKWIMDCHADACKLILCCDDDVGIHEQVTNRCCIVSIDAPMAHEIIEVLIQIARKENFDLSMNFASKIAHKSKQNLRRAIMALEACKLHKYPFDNDQPIPMGWEEVVVDLAAEILAGQSPKRQFSIREKLQKLLVEFVHPKLILQKLVEEFLKGVEANSRREVYYWHAYYDKRLPVGTSALLKLEGDV